MKKKLMQWTYFLDILGYGEEQKNIDNQEKADAFINFMKGSKYLIEGQEQLDKFFYKDKEHNIYDYYDVKTVFISDSFVLTAIPKENLFDEEDYYYFSTFIIMELTFKIFILLEYILKEKGLFLRGGISKKFTDIDIENSLAVGKGLIEAYSLESKFANVPRILLSKDILNDFKIMEFFLNHSKNYSENFSIFKKDKDNFYYLDYLGYMLSFLNKSERNRLNIQNELEDKYSINEELIQKLQKLPLNNSIVNNKTVLENFFIENNISVEKAKKIFASLKDTDGIILKYKDIIKNIQIVKKTTIETLEYFKENITKNLTKYSGDDKIIEKYMWLSKYLNESISLFPELDFIESYKIK
ncbi:hypothetical protein [Halarcobacter sp.]|uniref:hypothetical protein n=1 Tax=Halarcobacter sp. TaxID=2321133 RepID=UPI003A90C19C